MAGISQKHLAYDYYALPPNNSFKPNLLRYTNNVAGKACHVVGYSTQVGLTQALGPYGEDDAR